jgi:uncharacterized iron-regulated protein
MGVSNNKKDGDLSMNKILFLATLFSFQNVFAESWNGRIFGVDAGNEVSRESMIEAAALHKIVVIGETHMTQEVQDVEAAIIRDVVALTGENFTFAWEFLAHSQKEKTNALWKSFTSGKISGEDFVKEALGNAANNTYIPVLKTVADLSGQLVGINLTREEKAPVTKDGIKAADPKLVPDGYQPGGENYLERFKEIMGDHTTPEKLANYFDAQCLTDDVMADQMTKITTPKIFTIAGHFHTDYFDGYVKRLQVRRPSDPMIVIRIIDASEFTEDELLRQLVHAKYGQLAHYAYFVKEPIAAVQKSY